MLILIITHSKDISADLVIRHLENQDAKYVRLDCDQLGTPDYFFGFQAEPELHIGGRVVYASQISAVWARRFTLPAVLESVGPTHRDFVRRELSTVMDAFLDGTDAALHINPHAADHIAGNRLLQSQKAKRVGFTVPKSIVTQSRYEAEAFLAATERSVTKSISFGQTSSDGQVCFTTVVDSDVDLNGLFCCPSLFQEAILKQFDWRVTIVGDRIFSAKICSDCQDWRSDRTNAQRFVGAVLPNEIAERLLALHRESKIVYGAHDLIETPHGDFVFLETNPAGQWAWLELTLGLPIGRALADELVRGTRR